MLEIPEKFTEESYRIFGENHQLDILQEECSEVIKAISKMKRGKAGARAELIEEITHVLMSIQLVCRIQGISQNDINPEITKKVIKYNFDLRG